MFPTLVYMFLLARGTMEKTNFMLFHYPLFIDCKIGRCLGWGVVFFPLQSLQLLQGAVWGISLAILDRSCVGSMHPIQAAKGQIWSWYVIWWGAETPYNYFVSSVLASLILRWSGPNTERWSYLLPCLFIAVSCGTAHVWRSHIYAESLLCVLGQRRLLEAGDKREGWG